MMQIGAAFNMGLDSVGNLMTFFSITGLVVSLPGVWIMRNLGIKTSLLIGGLITLIGGLLGVTAQSAEMMLFSRVLEGMGLTVITVLGPNVIPRLFPESKYGLVMGVWSMWPAGGMIFTSLAGPAIYEASGWQGIWWVSIALSLVALLLCLVFCKFNKVSEKVLENKAESKGNIARPSFIASGVILAVFFMTYCGLYGCVTTFYPTFLQEVKGMSVAMASMPVLVIAILTIPLSIVIGMITDKFNIRKWWLVVTYLVLSLSGSFLAYNMSPEEVTPWVTAVFIAIAAGGIPVTTRALIPILIADQRKMDYVLGIMSATTYIGFMFATPFGALAASTGWTNAALIFYGCFGLVTTVIMAIFVKNDHALMKQQQKELAAHGENLKQLEQEVLSDE